MRIFNLFCLTGLLFILCGCEPKQDPPFPPDNGVYPLPHEMKGSVHLESSTWTQSDSSSFIHTASISKVEFLDTLVGFVHLKLTFMNWPYTTVINLKCNGPGFYPFSYHPNNGESYVYTWPKCGLDSDPGGYGFEALESIDTGVEIVSFSSQGIEGNYQGQFFRSAIWSDCYAWPVDTVDIYGTFKTTF